MNKQRPQRHIYFFTLLLISFPLLSCAHPPAGDSAAFDADGTAHITRIIPTPSTIRPEAQKWLDSLARQKYAPQSLPNAASPRTSGEPKIPRKRESFSP